MHNDRKHLIWNNADANDYFEAEGDSFQAVLLHALSQLGWSVSDAPMQMTLIDLVPEYNAFSQQWEVRETDYRDNEIAVHCFDSSEEADAWVDEWVKARATTAAPDCGSPLETCFQTK